MMVNGATPTVASGMLRLVYLSVAHAAVGRLLVLVVEWYANRIDDGPIQNAISILVPYSASLADELIHASGVLAVVAAGMYRSPRSSRFFSPSVRLQAGAAWTALIFILNGLVFLTIGLQLPYVLAELGSFPRYQLVLYGAAFSALLILLR